MHVNEATTSTAPLVDASAPLVDTPAIGRKVRRRRPLLTHSLVCLAGAVAGAGIAVALFVALPHTPDDPPPPLPSCPNVTCGRLDGTFRGSVDSSVSIFGVPVRLAWDISHRFNSTNGTVEVVQTSHSPHAPSFHCPATPFNVSDGCAVSIGLCYGDARDVQAQPVVTLGQRLDDQRDDVQHGAREHLGSGSRRRRGYDADRLRF